MPWYVVLIIALASLALVVAMLAWVGIKGWRLAKHGMAVSRRVTPLVDGLTRRADEAALAVERLSSDADQLTSNIARLQVSLARLQVVVRAFRDALRPYRLLRGWLSGQREWTRMGL
jgi:hypothetical protein